MKKYLLLIPKKYRCIVQRLLEAESFNVFTSATIHGATAIMNAETFDFVIANPDIPGKNEFDFVRWLQEYSADTTVMLLTDDVESASEYSNVVVTFK